MVLNNTERMTDSELAALSQKGDMMARSELVRRYEPLVKSLCQIEESEEFREDLGQDLWIAFLEAVERFNPVKGNFPALVKASLRGVRANLLKKERSRTQVETGTEEELLSLPLKDSTQGEKAEALDLLQRLTCTAAQMRILSLALKGYGTVEIARILGVSHATVAVQRRRIQKKFQKILE